MTEGFSVVDKRNVLKDAFLEACRISDIVSKFCATKLDSDLWGTHIIISELIEKLREVVHEYDQKKADLTLIDFEEFQKAKKFVEYYGFKIPLDMDYRFIAMDGDGSINLFFDRPQYVEREKVWIRGSYCRKVDCVFDVSGFEERTGNRIDFSNTLKAI